ncbi:MAG TPA: hypothetical protein V6C97_15080 [Oculatellaceae cyanobacterium]
MSTRLVLVLAEARCAAEAEHVQKIQKKYSRTRRGIAQPSFIHAEGIEPSARKRTSSTDTRSSSASAVSSSLDACTTCNGTSCAAAFCSSDDTTSYAVAFCTPDVDAGCASNDHASDASGAYATSSGSDALHARNAPDARTPSDGNADAFCTPYVDGATNANAWEPFNADATSYADASDTR